MPHTPEPWHLEPPLPNRPFVMTLYGDDHRTKIADVSKLNPADGPMLLAAPKLLAACKLLVQAIGSDPGWMHEPGLRVAEDAITEAEKTNA